MLQHFDYPYRLWVIRELVKLFTPPVAVVFAGIRTLEATENRWLVNRFTRIVAYLIGVPVQWAARYYITRWNDERQARLRGTTQPPIIEGKMIGNIDLLKRFAPAFTGGYMGDIVDQILDEHGVNTIRMALLWNERIMTRDPSVVKFILTTGFNEFEKGYQAYVRMGSFFGKGIFCSDGELAKFHRTLARPYFARERISDFDCFHKYTEKLITILRDTAGSDTACDVQDLFGRYSFDTGGEILLGRNDFNTLDLPLPQAGKAKAGPKGVATEGLYGGFISAFDKAQVNIAKRNGMGQYAWAIKEFFNDSQAQHAKVISEYLEPLSRNAIERRQRGLIEEQEEHDYFIDHLAASSDDVQLIKDQLLNVLMAARDTTTCLLTNTCYFLAKYPDVMKRLRNEVTDNYGYSQAPSYKDIPKLRFMRAVLEETLRLLPPVPNNIRATVTNGTVIPSSEGPLYVPRAGTQVMWSAICIHKRKDLWGSDADEFDPDRWLDRRAKDATADPFRFVPFNAGQRICLGQEFAYNQVTFVLVRLLQVFDQFTIAQKESAPPGTYPPEEWKEMGGRKAVEECWPQSGLSLYIRGGMWLKMHVDTSL